MTDWQSNKAAEAAQFEREALELTFDLASPAKSSKPGAAPLLRVAIQAKKEAAAKCRRLAGAVIIGA